MRKKTLRRHMKTDISQPTYDELLDNIGKALRSGREYALKAVNSEMVSTYWNIGRHIVEYEQKGHERAEYGTNLIDRLAHDLTATYGKGFSRSNVIYMRKFYLCFPKRETLSHQLTWSHYFEILKAEDSLAIGFYAQQCEKEQWSVRELKRQMKSSLFQRLALSRDKTKILELSRKGQEVQNPQDLIKAPFVLEFVGLPQQETYLEGELEQRLIQNLEGFLLELGKGFAFVGRQYRINIGSRHFYVDFVFSHRTLKCFVLIDLKRGEIEHHDIGQMNLYLNYFKKEESTEGDHEPIGIILGAYKDKVLVEYAMQGMTNQLFVSRYQLYLPNKAQLQKEVLKILSDHETDNELA